MAAVPHASKYASKKRQSRQQVSQELIQRRLDAGEISLRFAFELAWLEDLPWLAENFRQQFLRQTTTSIAEIPSRKKSAETNVTKLPKIKKSAQVLRGFGELAELMREKVA